MCSACVTTIIALLYSITSCTYYIILCTYSCARELMIDIYLHTTIASCPKSILLWWLRIHNIFLTSNIRQRAYYSLYSCIIWRKSFTNDYITPIILIWCLHVDLNNRKSDNTYYIIMCAFLQQPHRYLGKVMFQGIFVLNGFG